MSDLDAADVQSIRTFMTELIAMIPKDGSPATFRDRWVMHPNEEVVVRRASALGRRVLTPAVRQALLDEGLRRLLNQPSVGPRRTRDGRSAIGAPVAARRSLARRVEGEGRTVTRHAAPFPASVRLGKHFALSFEEYEAALPDDAPIRHERGGMKNVAVLQLSSLAYDLAVVCSAQDPGTAPAAGIASDDPTGLKEALAEKAKHALGVDLRRVCEEVTSRALLARKLPKGAALPPPAGPNGLPRQPLPKDANPGDVAKFVRGRRPPQRGPGFGR